MRSLISKAFENLGEPCNFSQLCISDFEYNYQVSNITPFTLPMNKENIYESWNIHKAGNGLFLPPAHSDFHSCTSDASLFRQISIFFFQVSGRIFAY